MVLLFGIYSLEGPQAHSLFCKCMAADDSQTLFPEQTEAFKNCKDECSSRIADQMHSIFHFNRASHLRGVENDNQLLNSDHSLPPFEVGHFKLNWRDPFCFETHVVWLTVNDIGFCFVLDERENLTEAEMTLRLIVQQLHDWCRITLQSEELVSKMEKIHFVLHKFIPGGKLVFMNHRMIRQLDKEAEGILKVMGI